VQKGWELISPETLSIPAQIQLFKQARAVCGLHGSALTNLLWASPGCRVLELCPSNFLAGAFEWVAKILGLPHSFLICESDSHFRATVDLRALEAKLDTMT
jgi:capsular polysaccharide biosynthesis protein